MIDAERFRKIDQIFQVALDLDGGERAAYIEEACHGDQALIDEVGRLLAADEASCSILENRAFEMVAPVLAGDTPALHPGEQFGKYRIIGLLGVGGMGHVYLAEDPALRRKVALKLLPAVYTRDAWRLARFEQEAQSASALNHPNILTVHEFGNADGHLFIATEYVEGETLRERLKRSRMPLPDVLDIAIQISGALTAAHKAEIVHRDIKPENIMLRSDGYVKVLDFGLAKLTEQPDAPQATGDRVNANLSSGLVMGTVKYMSPEQAQAHPIDARSDIFSLGIVIYEMVAGRIPFTGETSSDVVAAILRAAPAEIDESPAAIRNIIFKALAKKREYRYQTAQELTLDLALANGGPAETSIGVVSTSQALRYSATTEPPLAVTTRSAISTIVTGARKEPAKYILATCGVLLVAITAAMGIIRSLGFNEPTQGAKVTRVPTADKARSVAISPTGEYIVYAEMSGPARSSAQQSLWVESLSTAARTQIRAPEEADYTSLTYSPDGSEIFFTIGGVLYKLGSKGGDPTTVLSGVSGAISFSPNGEQFAFVRGGPRMSELMIASANGSGEQVLVSRARPEFLSLDGPAWSPDGSRIVVAAGRQERDSKMHLMAFNLASKEETPLLEQPWDDIHGRLVWSPDGGSIMCVAADGADVQIWKVFTPSGKRLQVTTTIGYDYSNLAISADGRRLTALASAWRSSLWVGPIDEPGSQLRITTDEHDTFMHVAWGPERSVVYASSAKGGRDIWTMNSDGTGSRQLTANTGINQQPNVSKDGRFIVFSSNRASGSPHNIWRTRSDGTDPVQVTSGDGEVQPVISPDNSWIVYTKGSPTAGFDQKTLWKVPASGNGEPVALVDRPSGAGDISPDGTTVAFWIKVEDRGPMKLALMPLDGGPVSKTFEVTRTGNHPPRWSQDGRYLYYIKTSPFLSNIWRQAVSGGPPEQVTMFNSDLIGGFDVTEDGSLLCSRRHAVQDVLLLSQF